MPDIQSIMREERQATLAALDKLPLPTETRVDVLKLCAALQDAVNDTIASLDRAIDQRAAPAAMRLMADEIERCSRRFVEAGLARPPQ